MAETEPVTRASLRVVPIAAPVVMAAVPERTWSDQEWQRIRLGYRADDMDEKWDVFVEDRVAFLHRSWTGHGVFEATFEPVAGRGWRIATGVVEADAARYRRSGDHYDRVLLELVLTAIVLGEPAAALRAELVALVALESGRSDIPAGLVLHSVLGLRS